MIRIDLPHLWPARLIISIALLAVSVWPLRGDTSSAGMPDYAPQQRISDTIRSWGSDEMASLLKTWETGFRGHHPEALFADTMKGSDTAQAALYTEVADLGLMDRKILFVERHVMFRRKHRLPFEITVATGSADAVNHTFALAVFVHKDNPLAKLTVKQLDGIFGEQRTGAWDEKFFWLTQKARPASENIRTWGQLGLTGEWADKPIQVYGYPVTSYSTYPDPMLCFRGVAFSGADMWNANLREYPKSDDITAALGGDRYGIAYTGLGFRTPNVKPVALETADGRSVELNRQTVASRQYPLFRSIYIYIDPGQLREPKVSEFLNYILSKEGQAAVAREGSYLSLPAAEVLAQRERIAAAKAQL